MTETARTPQEGNPRVVLLEVHVHKTPSNEVPGEDWVPSAREVAAFVQGKLSRIETDGGWDIGMVVAARRDAALTSQQAEIDRLKEAVSDEFDARNRAEDRARHYEAELRAARKVVASHDELLTLASIAHDGDPWYAEHAGIDGDAILHRAVEARATYDRLTTSEDKG